MKRTTIFVPEALERDLQLYARRERKPVASVVREALAEYLVSRSPGSSLPSFTGVGRSGRTDIAARHEELLWTDPHDEEAASSPVAIRTRRRHASRTKRR
jgi:hypothetical protein